MGHGRHASTSEILLHASLVVSVKSQRVAMQELGPCERWHVILRLHKTSPAESLIKQIEELQQKLAPCLFGFFDSKDFATCGLVKSEGGDFNYRSSTLASRVNCFEVPFSASEGPMRKSMPCAAAGGASSGSFGSNEESRRRPQPE